MHNLIYRKFFPGLLIFIFISVVSRSQTVFRAELKNSTFIASDSILPFWFSANRHGTIEPANSFLNLTKAGVDYVSEKDMNAPVSFALGIEIIAGLGERNYSQLNRMFGAVSLNGWELKAGMFHDSEKFQGLSVTNGNLARSLHARPYPKVRFSVREFKAIPFVPDYLRFKAEYDEGFLNDNRYVANARLHHKSVYLQYFSKSGWKITGGFEHFVFWGGISPNPGIGKMPSRFKSYLRYILGSGGNDEFPETDRANKAGNQLGTYQLEVQKSFSETEFTFYLTHPFEDLSGVNLKNWPDNLAGLYINFTGNPRLVSGLLYEYTSTWQQSIRGDWDRQEPDNYFNHGIYRSGFTYHGKMLGSPLFLPDFSDDGKVVRITSNRLFAHNFGITGHWNSKWKWKGLMTYSEHAGTVTNPVKPNRKQLSGLAEVQYAGHDFPLEIGLSLAADAGSTNLRNFGVMLSVAKKW